MKKKWNEQLLILVEQKINQLNASTESMDQLSPVIDGLEVLVDKLNPNNINTLNLIEENDLYDLNHLFKKKDEQELVKEMLGIRYLTVGIQTQNLVMKIDEKQLKAFRSFIELLQIHIHNLKKLVEQMHIQKNQLNYYYKLEDKLQNLNQRTYLSEMQEIKEILQESTISEEEQRNLMLELLKHNGIVYTNLMESTGEIKKDSELEEKFMDEKSKEVEACFEKYNFDYYTLTTNEKILLNEYATLSNMEDVMECIRRLGISFLNHDASMLVDFLLLASSSTITQINRMARQYAIDVERFKRCPEVFFEDLKQPYLVSGKNNKQPRFENFKHNVEFLFDLGLDIKKIFDTSLSVLLENHEKIMINKEILERYHISIPSLLGNEKYPSYKVLSSLSLASNLDRYIELNCNTYIHQDISTLNNNDDEIFERIYISNLYDISIFRSATSEQKKLNRSILYGTGFFKSRPQIEELIPTAAKEYIDKTSYKDLLPQYEEYLFHPSIFKNKVIQAFDKEFGNKDLLEYHFGNIVISRLKFIRNLVCILEHSTKNEKNNLEEILLVSLIYQSYLKKEEIEYLKETISQVLSSLNAKGVE